MPFRITFGCLQVFIEIYCFIGPTVDNQGHYFRLVEVFATTQIIKT